MLQANEIQQRFSQIQQAVGQAAQTCNTDASAPPQLKDCIARLDRQASMAGEVMQSNDETRIRRCVDDMEMLGDEAKRACGMAGQVTPQLKEAVTQVHDQLSRLKHQLH